jgi:Kef-type K+ transport system membrane component KefB
MIACDGESARRHRRAAELDMLGDLAWIMCVAAATTVLFQRLHQPVVLGY